MTPRKLPLALTEESCRVLKNLYLETDYGQLDCLGSVTGIGDFKAARDESVEVQTSAGPCRVLSLRALIRAKEAMGRPRDRETVVYLKALEERQGM